MNGKKKSARKNGSGKADATKGTGLRCPHCGYRMTVKEIPPGPVKPCPACRMVISSGDVA